MILRSEKVPHGVSQGVMCWSFLPKSSAFQSLLPDANSAAIRYPKGLSYAASYDALLAVN
jgi:hypothetical protein